ncbi:MAG: hypothetical protein IPJ98_09030 [Bryobacterales bacterium]|nr:hypothetical protein [Bryobacterales bacterium]
MRRLVGGGAASKQDEGPFALSTGQAATTQTAVASRVLIILAQQKGEQMTPAPATERITPGEKGSALWEGVPTSQHWVAYVGLLFLSAGTLCGSQDAPPAVLTVYMRDAGECSSRLLSEMQAEAGGIMRPAGIRLVWRHFHHAQCAEPVPALVVLTLEGACRSEGRCRAAGPLAPLGWTHSTDGEILPFCVVDCDRVRHVVDPNIRHLPVETREFLYGKALGRVVAHELYHIIANTTGHATEGLAKPLLTASELVWGLCRFGKVEVDSLRRAAMRAFRMVEQSSAMHQRADVQGQQESGVNEDASQEEVLGKTGIAAADVTPVQAPHPKE